MTTRRSFVSRLIGIGAFLGLCRKVPAITVPHFEGGVLDGESIEFGTKISFTTGLLEHCKHTYRTGSYLVTEEMAAECAFTRMPGDELDEPYLLYGIGENPPLGIITVASVKRRKTHD